MFQHRTINNHINLGILDLKAFSDHIGVLKKRELEKAGTLFLLKKMLKTESIELGYSPENKPFLRERSEHLSISHSHDKLAIIINTEENTGVDIELIRDKVRLVQQKFLNKRELSFANNDIEKLITLWAAKETLYKLYGKKELDFLQHISVPDFSSPDLIGKIEKNALKKSYNMRFEKIENYILVYCLNEI